ncbi:valine--tRNA ligase [Hanamia caeni]|uniref:Valine--tRNA ligase n=1 Tax=Hanamia caeni TaxID=2294116 RepID=A0A3M9N895_9BACT|nr:valine--tRNA ligase [Hanamia caeni]RNI34044.1 valine--tRNA ligase [Hanamia caeni]
MELSKNYIPGPVEEKWNAHWKLKEYFNSLPDESKPPFTVVIPPPNVTGVLHMGHTLNETVQDILVRKARMSGFNACWVPGSDHASIATEAKVVEMLKREKGIDKKNLSREEFLKYAFEWKEKYGNIIYNQIEKLGCSVDWNRVSFTMDDHYYKAVIKVFVDLYNKGLIYRGARMINWDPVAKTALSDEEVEYKDVTGKLFYIKYAVSGTQNAKGARQKAEDNEENYIVIATQRPETIMGDVAVCANPGDDRYEYLKGKKVIVPLIDKEVPVIFDEYVDKDFGTGILKITPAHDINDFNIGLKFNLPVVDTLNEDGTLSEAAQIYIGEDRFEARKKIVDELKEKGLLVKEEEYTTRLGYSQRTNAVAEPKISTQWFVKMKGLAEPALEAVTNGDIKIHPAEKYNATYKYWLENVKDWCISRQLWWGQQIPAWYDEEGRFVVAETEEKAKKIFSDQYSVTNAQLKQDEDVLDTWFSSWLWPIEVFRGITEPGNKDINYYYPTSVLVTGQDIIFFWVARMIMAGMEYMKEKPFSDVYFTGMVRDKLGRKMSKSLGNSPDLLTLIHEYGADAVRFGIMISSPAGNDLLFDESSLEQGKHFNNKLWNATKLLKMWEEGTTDNPPPTTDLASGGQSSVDGGQFAITWFENRLNEVRIEIENLMQQFRLSEALKTIYSLIWDDFCSWYLEWIKPEYGKSISKNVYEKSITFFDNLLQLLHPFMPFITEEIYHLLKKRNDDLAVKQFQPVEKFDSKILQEGLKLKNVITSIRDAKNKNNLKPKEPVSLFIDTAEESSYHLIKEILAKQTNADKIVFNEAPASSAIMTVAGNEKIYIESDTAIDSSVQTEKLTKDLNYLKGFLITINKKLTNDKFVNNARPEVIELERKKKSDTESKINVIEQTLASLNH